MYFTVYTTVSRTLNEYHFYMYVYVYIYIYIYIYTVSTDEHYNILLVIPEILFNVKITDPKS